MDFLSSEVVEIEASIGVTKAGRSQKLYLGRTKEEPKLFVNGQMDRDRARKLMEMLNDVSTWCIFTKRSPQWNIECMDLLLQLLDTQRLQRYREIEGGIFRETLDYLKNYSLSCLEVTQTSEARMQLQLNIVSFLSLEVLHGSSVRG